MNIKSIAKAALLPVVFFPIACNSKPVDKKPTVIKRSVSEQQPVQSITQREVKPFDWSKISNTQITEVITDENRLHPGIDAYYKVDTKNKGAFYIARSEYGRTGNIFGVSYKEEEKQKGLVFPKSDNDYGLIATVDAKKAGLNGVFEIYDLDDRYKVHYRFSPLLYIPGHTKVSANFLINIENSIKELPSKLTNELYNLGITVMLGKDYNDVYYYYNPDWKSIDDWKPYDPSKPVCEITESGFFIDRRKFMHVKGLFFERTAVVPQQYIDYYTNKIFDYSKDKEMTKYILYYESGSSLDHAYSSAFSDLDGFQAAHTADTKTFSLDDRKKLVYFYRNRSGTFAELTAALLGGLTKERAAIMLHKFPKCAEFIRDNVLPRIDVNISIEQIRNIYPDYLNRDAKEGKTAVQN